MNDILTACITLSAFISAYVLGSSRAEAKAKYEDFSNFVELMKKAEKANRGYNHSSGWSRCLLYILENYKEVE
ncbi:hypothetical protein ACSSTF_004785 [Escherichia coli]